MFFVTDDFLPPGGYNLNIEATDVLGQSATLDVPFTLTGTLGCIAIVLVL